tara:strand:+ start:640 stop:1617 length:978 start_codon:yes stop_codon:yes gene_type:complete
MKKLSLYIFLVLMWCSVANALPKCEGDETQWTNCQGIYLKKEVVPGWTRDFTGEFGSVPGKRHGKGASKIYKDGILNATYVGEYKDDKAHGQGTESLANGSKYVGEYQNGKPNGFGIMTFPRKPTLTGDKLIGQFKNGEPDGQAAFIRANGQITKGEYRGFELINDQSLPLCDRKKSYQTYNNCQNLGMYFSPKGDKYGDDPENFEGKIFNGEYKNGKLNGIGMIISTLPNKEMEYVGELKNSFIEGFGSMTFIDGSEYVGYFKKEVLEGEGILIYSDQSKAKSKKKKLVYFGNFKNGKKSGKGTLIIENENIIRGVWKEGKLLN